MIEPPDDLHRSGLAGKFPPATEQRYRVWFVAQTRFLVRIVATLSIAIWLFLPFAASAWVGEAIDDRAYVLGYALVVPILVVLVIVTFQTSYWLQVVVASLALVVVALVSFQSFYAGFPIPSLAGILGSLIWLNTLPIAVRAPFWNTLVLTLITTVGGSAFLLASVRELDTPRAETWPYISLILIDLLMVPAMSLISERALRKTYADEQLIARQQEELIASRTLIRRYAPPAVADRLEHGDTTVGTAQRRRVTIFFADVVGFTTLADRLDPEALAEIMNDYLGAVSEIVERHRGTLNEFAGDGVMAIFGAPDELEPADQVSGALAAARELQQSLPDWSRRWYSLGIDEDLLARIGINTGVISVGTFGSAVRATYTGIGLQTNIAARIQAQCPPGSVLLSKTSWHLIGDEVPCTPHGEVEVKGVHYPIAMYEPV